MCPLGSALADGVCTPPPKRQRTAASGGPCNVLLTPAPLPAASSGLCPLGDVLARAPPTFAGELAEHLWTYQEERLVTSEGHVLTRRSRMPELGCLLCASKDLSIAIVAGVKELRGNSKARSYEQLMEHCRLLSFLQQFRSTWTGSRKLRHKVSSEADKEEATLILQSHIGRH
mmetsp:Transcript_84552/g.217837  ORF Transcript_84552/g.217837 Transcript_84552/m.217837 type:complete len:173 (+) Transcript_84552:93-611(+)